MSALGTRQFFRYHPVIGHTFIPGLKARAEHEGGGYLVRVNSSGFRSSREFKEEKPDGIFRVLLFGDSFIAGDGVSNGYRFGDLLESRIPNLEVYNYGISGTGHDQHYLTYREFARAVEHDLVVIASPIENIARITARYMKFATSDGEGYRLFARPYFTRAAGNELELHHVPVPEHPLAPDAVPPEFVYPAGRPEQKRLRQVAYSLGPRFARFARRVGNRDPAPQFQSPDEPAWLLLNAILTRWASEAAAPVTAFPIPLYQHIECLASPAGYQARYAELRVPGLDVVDPLPSLLQFTLAERRAFRFETDVHPTRAGHEALADALEPAIRSRMAASQLELSA